MRDKSTAIGRQLRNFFFVHRLTESQVVRKTRDPLSLFTHKVSILFTFVPNGYQGEKESH